VSGRRIKASKVDREDYHKYWKKAEEFYETAEDRLTKGKWNAAALNAIHSGISANDALLVCFHGVKSISPKHDDAMRLLTSLVEHEKTEANAAHLRKLIGTKHIVEYESRLFIQKEAQALVEHAKRFLDWVDSILPDR